MIISQAANDVTAVVLSTGEPTTDRALASLQRQSLPPREIVLVRNVVPFHKALNAGLAQVKTPFFVQVDADMILYAWAIAALRTAMTRNVGIVLGRLRDAIVGQVVGVKLFRTRCFEIAAFRDTISPDTDFIEDIARAGWRTKYIGKSLFTGGEPWRSFGEHAPNYTPTYVYRKYMLAGSRYHYRRTVGSLQRRFEELGKSNHSCALIAQIALARGLYLDPTSDLLGVLNVEGEWSQLDAFLTSSARSGGSGAPFVLPTSMPIDVRFREFCRAGRALFRCNDVMAFRATMAALDDPTLGRNGWICKVGLCQGLLATDYDRATIDTAYRHLISFAAIDDWPRPRRFESWRWTPCPTRGQFEQNIVRLGIRPHSVSA